jgi:hypothetical protein
VDGELSPAMRAEMHAHRLKCPECSRELAVIEACADVLYTDRREPALSADFTDRVLAGLGAVRPSAAHRWRRIALYVSSPVAAAAVLAFMFTALVQPPARTPMVQGISQRLPDNMAKNYAAVQGMSDDQKREFLNTPQMASKGVLEALWGSTLDRTNAALTQTRRDMTQIADFVSYGLLPTKVVLPADDGGTVTKATPAPAESSTEGAWFDMVDPGVEHPVQPAASKAPEVVEMM